MNTHVDMVVSLGMFFRIYVSEISCRDNQNTRFMLNQLLPPPPRKSWRLWDVEKCGTAGQTTDDAIIRRMRTACWITRQDIHIQNTVIPRLTSDPANEFFRLTKIFSLFFGLG